MLGALRRHFKRNSGSKAKEVSKGGTETEEGHESKNGRIASVPRRDTRQVHPASIVQQHQPEQVGRVASEEDKSNEIVNNTSAKKVFGCGSESVMQGGNESTLYHLSLSKEKPLETGITRWNDDNSLALHRIHGLLTEGIQRGCGNEDEEEQVEKDKRKPEVKMREEEGKQLLEDVEQVSSQLKEVTLTDSTWSTITINSDNEETQTGTENTQGITMDTLDEIYAVDGPSEDQGPLLVSKTRDSLEEVVGFLGNNKGECLQLDGQAGLYEVNFNCTPGKFVEPDKGSAEGENIEIKCLDCKANQCVEYNLDTEKKSVIEKPQFADQEQLNCSAAPNSVNDPGLKLLDLSMRLTTGERPSSPLFPPLSTQIMCGNKINRQAIDRKPDWLKPVVRELRTIPQSVVPDKNESQEELRITSNYDPSYMLYFNDDQSQCFEQQQQILSFSSDTEDTISPNSDLWCENSSIPCVFEEAHHFLQSRRVPIDLMIPSPESGPNDVESTYSFNGLPSADTRENLNFIEELCLLTDNFNRETFITSIGKKETVNRHCGIVNASDNKCCGTKCEVIVSPTTTAMATVEPGVNQGVENSGKDKQKTMEHQNSNSMEEVLRKELEEERMHRLQAEDRLRSVQEENESYKAQLSTLRSDIDRMEKMMKNLLQLKSEMKHLLDEKSSLEAAYESQLKRYRSCVEVLQQENLLLFNELKRMENDLPSLQNSNSEEGGDSEKTTENSLTRILLNRLRLLEQENLAMAQENEQQRIQYEKCLDDVANQVVQALLAQKKLREECIRLHRHIRELEDQNRFLSFVFSKQITHHPSEQSANKVNSSGLKDRINLSSRQQLDSFGNVDLNSSSSLRLNSLSNLLAPHPSHTSLSSSYQNHSHNSNSSKTSAANCSSIFAKPTLSRAASLLTRSSSARSNLQANATNPVFGSGTDYSRHHLADLILARNQKEKGFSRLRQSQSFDKTFSQRCTPLPASEDCLRSEALNKASCVSGEAQRPSTLGVISPFLGGSRFLKLQENPRKSMSLRSAYEENIDPTPLSSSDPIDCRKLQTSGDTAEISSSPSYFSRNHHLTSVNTVLKRVNPSHSNGCSSHSTEKVSNPSCLRLKPSMALEATTGSQNLEQGASKKPESPVSVTGEQSSSTGELANKDEGYSTMSSDMQGDTPPNTSVVSSETRPSGVTHNPSNSVTTKTAPSLSSQRELIKEAENIIEKMTIICKEDLECRDDILNMELWKNQTNENNNSQKEQNIIQQPVTAASEASCEVAHSGQVYARHSTSSNQEPSRIMNTTDLLNDENVYLNDVNARKDCATQVSLNFVEKDTREATGNSDNLHINPNVQGSAFLRKSASDSQLYDQQELYLNLMKNKGKLNSSRINKQNESYVRSKRFMKSHESIVNSSLSTSSSILSDVADRLCTPLNRMKLSSVTEDDKRNSDFSTEYQSYERYDSDHSEFVHHWLQNESGLRWDDSEVTWKLNDNNVQSSTQAPKMLNINDGWDSFEKRNQLQQNVLSLKHDQKGIQDFCVAQSTGTAILKASKPCEMTKSEISTGGEESFASMEFTTKPFNSDFYKIYLVDSNRSIETQQSEGSVNCKNLKKDIQNISKINTPLQQPEERQTPAAGPTRQSSTESQTRNSENSLTNSSNSTSKIPASRKLSSGAKKKVTRSSTTNAIASDLSKKGKLKRESAEAKTSSVTKPLSAVGGKMLLASQTRIPQPKHSVSLDQIKKDSKVGSHHIAFVRSESREGRSSQSSKRVDGHNQRVVGHHGENTRRHGQPNPTTSQTKIVLRRDSTTKSNSCDVNLKNNRVPTVEELERRLSGEPKIAVKLEELKSLCKEEVETSCEQPPVGNCIVNDSAGNESRARHKRRKQRALKEGHGTSWIHVTCHDGMPNGQTGRRKENESSSDTSSEEEVVGEDDYDNQFYHRKLHALHRFRRQKKRASGRDLVISYVPRNRVSIVNRKEFYYRFGDMEEAAIASFDFLNELSSSSSSPKKQLSPTTGQTYYGFDMDFSTDDYLTNNSSKSSFKCTSRSNANFTSNKDYVLPNDISRESNDNYYHGRQQTSV